MHHDEVGNGRRDEVVISCHARYYLAILMTITNLPNTLNSNSGMELLCVHRKWEWHEGHNCSARWIDGRRQTTAIVSTFPQDSLSK